MKYCLLTLFCYSSLLYSHPGYWKKYKPTLHQKVSEKPHQKKLPITQLQQPSLKNTTHNNDHVVKQMRYLGICYGCLFLGLLYHDLTWRPIPRNCTQS